MLHGQRGAGLVFLVSSSWTPGRWPALRMQAHRMSAWGDGLRATISPAGFITLMGFLTLRHSASSYGLERRLFDILAD